LGHLPRSEVFAKLTEAQRSRLQDLDQMALDYNVPARDGGAMPPMEILDARPARGKPPSFESVERYVDVRKKLSESLHGMSESVSAVGYALALRLRGLGWEDPAFGPMTPAREEVGNVLVCDALESLMADYVRAAGPDSEPWKGLVVFGYVARDRFYYHDLCLLPHYASHNWDYWPLLAHEAGHRVQKLESFGAIRWEIIRELLLRPDERADLLVSWSSAFEPTDRVVPRERDARRLAGELVCDMYAVACAGPSYVEALLHYYLPVMCDGVVLGAPGARAGTRNDSPVGYFVAYRQAALKALVSIASAERLGLYGNPRGVHPSPYAELSGYVRTIMDRGIDHAVRLAHSWHAQYGRRRERTPRWITQLEELTEEAGGPDRPANAPPWERLETVLQYAKTATTKLAREVARAYAVPVRRLTDVPQTPDRLRRYWDPERIFQQLSSGAEVPPRQLTRLFSEDVDWSGAGRPSRFRPLLDMASHALIRDRYVDEPRTPR
jgi:hypothetical protein